MHKNSLLEISVIVKIRSIIFFGVKINSQFVPESELKMYKE